MTFSSHPVLSDTVYSPEELIAMIFNHARMFAEAYAGDALMKRQKF